MNLFFNVLLYIFFISPINENDTELLFIGHAYGNPHAGNDEKIEPSLLTFLNNKDLSKYKYIVWGGDFFETCSNESEVENFFKLLPYKAIEKSIFVYGNHEMYCYEKETLRFIKKNENQLITINDYDLFFINSNFKNINQVNQALKLVEKSEKKIIFTHQVIFSPDNWFLRTNSRDFYSVANKFYNELIKISKNITIISGDIGAFKRMPYLVYFKNSGNNLIASGLGNGVNNYIVSIKIEKNDLSFHKINLDDGTKSSLKPDNINYSTTINAIQFFFFSKKRGFAFVLLLISPIFYFIYRKYKKNLKV